MSEAGGDGQKPRARFMVWLDVLVKLTVPLGALGAALLANSIKDDISWREILINREESESTLRATMFGHLIGPILGTDRGQPLDADKERLLVELLALNFHEHFEFKPLLLSADEDLRYLTPDGVRKITHRDDMSEDDTREWIASRRNSLQSIASRIRDRQLAAFGAPERKETCIEPGAGHEASDNHERAVRNAARVQISLRAPKDPQSEEPVVQVNKGAPEDSVSRYERHFVQSDDGDAFILSPVTILSPNCETQLVIYFEDPDWEQGNVRVAIHNTLPGSSDDPIDDFDFVITPYDLPLTDNTLLPNQNRFALSVKDLLRGEDNSLGEGKRSLVVELVWFPLDYFPPRERPTDYGKFSSMLNRKVDG